MGRIIEQVIGLITGSAEGAGDAEVRATPGLDADEADNNGAVRSDGRPVSEYTDYQVTAPSMDRSTKLDLPHGSSRGSKCLAVSRANRERP
jgi:hypothetical protein